MKIKRILFVIAVSENADNSANNEQTTYDGKENDRNDDRKGRLDGKVTRKKRKIKKLSACDKRKVFFKISIG